MKLTQVVFRQHIGWHFQQLWKLKSKRQIEQTKAHEVLKSKGVTIIEPDEILYPKPPYEKYDLNASFQALYKILLIIIIGLM